MDPVGLLNLHLLLFLAASFAGDQPTTPCKLGWCLMGDVVHRSILSGIQPAIRRQHFHSHEKNPVWPETPCVTQKNVDRPPKMPPGRGHIFLGPLFVYAGCSTARPPHKNQPKVKAPMTIYIPTWKPAYKINHSCDPCMVHLPTFTI